MTSSALECTTAQEPPKSLNDAIHQLRTRCETVAERLCSLQRSLEAAPAAPKDPGTPEVDDSMLGQALASLDTLNIAHDAIKNIGATLGFDV